MPAINPAYAKGPGGGGSGGASFPPDGVPGDVLVFIGPGNKDVEWGTVATASAEIGAIFDGAGDVLESGRYVDMRIPYNCTVVELTILADQIGSFFYDIRKSTYAAFPPGTGDSITGGGDSMVGVRKKQVVNPFGGSVVFAAGDVLRFILTAAAASITKATVSLGVVK